jgi:hypothetical protein
MENLSPCPNCGSRALFKSREVAAASQHGPNLLPGLGSFLRWGRMNIVVCRDCGLMRLFANPDARAKLAGSNKWSPL